MLSALSSLRDKAQQSKSQSEIDSFLQAVILAEGESGKYLNAITGSNCSDCPCRGKDIRNIAVGDACYISWMNVLSTVQAASGGLVSNLNKMLRDPWGSPYGLDENEGATPVGCVNDGFASAGPDGVLWNADDIRIEIPLTARPASCP